jgi:hypothetical protein
MKKIVITAAVVGLGLGVIYFVARPKGKVRKVESVTLYI